MIKRAILMIIAMFSTLGMYSFKYCSNEDDAVKTSYVSYYADKFNGRKTASGEVFNNGKLTAAHRTLPFGTKVKITNPKTSASIIVTVNDRGPFHSARSMDISKAAFDAISQGNPGVLTVEYQVISG